MFSFVINLFTHLVFVVLLVVSSKGPGEIA